MITHFKTEQFSGPLDLLLQLIQNNKLDITTVALSEVTEQYLHYLDSLEEKNAEDLADFLVIATRLLLIKSKNLLPQLLPDDDDGPTLEAQLRLYKMFVDVSKKVNTLWLRPAHAVFRVESPRKAVGFIPPANATLEALHTSMVQLVNRLRPPKALPETRIDRTVSIKEKIDTIRRLLQKSKHIGFHDVVSEARNRTEVIVTFLAILELMKQRFVALEQEDSFGDIVISPIS